MNLKNKSDQKAAEIYIGMGEYRYKLNFAFAAIDKMFEIAPNSYLSLSWGKQSIVLAHMLYQIKPDTPMYFLASWESFLLYNYEEVIDRFTSKWPVNAHIVMKDNVSDNDLDWQATRDLGSNDLASMVNRSDWDGWFWGLSKDESAQRRITLSRQKGSRPHPSIFTYKDGKYRCCPLMDWGIMDLAAYIVHHDIPLLDAYYEHGLEYRTTARITRDMAELGGMRKLKQQSMDAYNKIKKRFPQLTFYG